MSFISSAIKYMRRKIKGSLQCAKEEGLVAEEGVAVMGNCNFSTEPYLITLRKNVLISTDVVFLTHDGGIHAFVNRWEEYKNVKKFGRIEVGEETFIGARSIIMPGVKIGRNCVVGAGSVVTKDVPDESVVAGVPARRICSTREYAEKSLQAMPPDFDLDAYKADKRGYLEHIIKPL